MIKLSKTSKLDGVLSWSLQAIETCPGAQAAGGGLVPACENCYAVGGNYRFSNVKKPREFNRKDWKRDGWADDMVEALGNSRFFRWFDSGDCYSLALAEKILDVMQRTPWVSHWLPTRMHKFAKFSDVFSKMQSLSNVVVRFSSDGIFGERVSGETTSTIIPKDAPELAGDGAKICPAYQNEGKCGPCRACYSKDVPVIAYVGHGRSMVKNQRIIAKG